jgi:uncharacterized protein
MKKQFLAAWIWALALAGPAAAAVDGPIRWQSWSDRLFEQAQQEKRLVLLDLEAIWCHWCHVMDETTYKDPVVVQLLQKGYIAVKVDQDGRPDLSNRYEEYGWPATIIFDSKGKELAKLSGYQPPERMRAMLKAFLDDPTPGPSAIESRPVTFTSTGGLTKELLEELQKDHVDNYDTKYGSWGTVHKFLQSDPVEYSMELAATGDEQGRKMAIQTLDAQFKLLDPVWGGVFQYSHGGDWDHPHFERIMSVQSSNMRIYALAYAQFKNPKYRDAAAKIDGYLKNFLTSPEGAFYTSQDADLKQGQHAEGYFKLNDAGRRKLGIPRIDKHVYSRENGWVIEALAVLAGTTGEKAYLDDAIRAANWIVANRSLPDGGFRHDQKDTAGPYLGDNVAMGKAFLQLYATTADRAWLKRAEDAARFIAANFSNLDGMPGLVTSKITNPADPLRPMPQKGENIDVTRFANLLYHYSGNAEVKKLAEQGMKYLAMPDIAQRRPTAGVLLCNREMNSDPTHITIVGSKSDAEAQKLYAAALQYPGGYLRVEWWDDAEGALPNPDVQYPKLKRAAAFACTAGRCSTPIYAPARIAEVVEKFRKAGGA